jgi:hypothetical protein
VGGPLKLILWWEEASSQLKLCFKSFPVRIPDVVTPDILENI